MLQNNLEITNDSQIRGVCASCRHVPECMHLTHDKQHCEEFECDSAPKTRSQSAWLYPMPEESNPSETLGLCVNCTNLESCTLQRAEGGVWHCEEYR